MEEKRNAKYILNENENEKNKDKIKSLVIKTALILVILTFFNFVLAKIANLKYLNLIADIIDVKFNNLYEVFLMPLILAYAFIFINTARYYFNKNKENIERKLKNSVKMSTSLVIAFTIFNILVFITLIKNYKFFNNENLYQFIIAIYMIIFGNIFYKDINKISNYDDQYDTIKDNLIESEKRTIKYKLLGLLIIIFGIFTILRNIFIDFKEVGSHHTYNKFVVVTFILYILARIYFIHKIKKHNPNDYKKITFRLIKEIIKNNIIQIVILFIILLWVFAYYAFEKKFVF